MKVVSAPPRLRLAAAFLVVAPALAAAETVISSRAPSWMLPFQNMAFWGAVAAIAFLPLAWATWRAKSWAIRATLATNAIWAISTLWMAARMRNPGLGFFALCLACFLIAAFLLQSIELRKPYLAPHCHWYEGAPRALPEIACRIGNPAIQAKVARLDESGALLLVPSAETSRFPKKARIRLDALQRSLEVDAKLITISPDRGTAGYRFQARTPDAAKKVGDFCESMRGIGYA